MNLGPHAAFILWAYAAAAAIVAGLIVWVIIDRWRLTRALGELETHGIARRSERATGEKP
jgi:heme exporter protein D